MIKIGDSYISADTRQLMLGKLITTKEGKGEGEVNFVAETFHITLSSLFRTMLDKKIFSTAQEKRVIELDDWFKKIKKELTIFDEQVNKRLTILASDVETKDKDENELVVEQEEIVVEPPKKKRGAK